MTQKIDGQSDLKKFNFFMDIGIPAYDLGEHAVPLDKYSSLIIDLTDKMCSSGMKLKPLFWKESGWFNPLGGEDPDRGFSFEFHTTIKKKNNESIVEDSIKLNGHILTDIYLYSGEEDTPPLHAVENEISDGYFTSVKLLYEPRTGEIQYLTIPKIDDYNDSELRLAMNMKLEYNPPSCPMLLCGFYLSYKYRRIKG